MKKAITLLALLYIAAFAQQKGTFTDTRDGKTYKTTKIGEQVWMAENLNYGDKEPTSVIPPSDEANNILGGLGEREPVPAKSNIVLKNVTFLKNSRSNEDILQVVNERMPELKRTYSAYLEQYADWTGGRLVLKFTIAPSGDIISISIVSSTTNNSIFDDDIKNQVSKWKWEVISTHGQNTTPIIPFNFSK